MHSEIAEEVATPHTSGETEVDAATSRSEGQQSAAAKKKKKKRRKKKKSKNTTTNAAGPEATQSTVATTGVEPEGAKKQQTLVVPLVVQEARDMCATVAKLRFKADDLQVRLERIMDAIRTDASATPPVVRTGVATNLWQFLQTANARVAERHSSLQNSLLLARTTAARSKTVDRQRVHVRKIASLERLIKDCHFDATVFNCIVSMFCKTSIYAQLQSIKETQYFTNSQGEAVQKVRPDDEMLSFDDVLRQEKVKLLSRADENAKKDPDLFGNGSLLSMLAREEEDNDESFEHEVSEDAVLNAAIRQNRNWGKR